MIDSHCHLDHEPLFSNLNKVIERSKKVGIKKILTICTTFDSFKKIKEIAFLSNNVEVMTHTHTHANLEDN